MESYSMLESLMFRSSEISNHVQQKSFRSSEINNHVQQKSFRSSEINNHVQQKNNCLLLDAQVQCSTIQPTISMHPNMLQAQKAAISATSQGSPVQSQGIIAGTQPRQTSVRYPSMTYALQTPPSYSDSLALRLMQQQHIQLSTQQQSPCNRTLPQSQIPFSAVGSGNQNKRPVIGPNHAIIPQNFPISINNTQRPVLPATNNFQNQMVRPPGINNIQHRRPHPGIAVLQNQRLPGLAINDAQQHISHSQNSHLKNISTSVPNTQNQNNIQHPISSLPVGGVVHPSVQSKGATEKRVSGVNSQNARRLSTTQNSSQNKTSLPNHNGKGNSIGESHEDIRNIILSELLESSNPIPSEVTGIETNINESVTGQTVCPSEWIDDVDLAARVYIAFKLIDPFLEYEKKITESIKKKLPRFSASDSSLKSPIVTTIIDITEEPINHHTHQPSSHQEPINLQINQPSPHQEPINHQTDQPSAHQTSHELIRKPVIKPKPLEEMIDKSIISNSIPPQTSKPSSDSSQDQLSPVEISVVPTVIATESTNETLTLYSEKGTCNIKTPPNNNIIVTSVYQPRLIEQSNSTSKIFKANSEKLILSANSNNQCKSKVLTESSVEGNLSSTNPSLNKNKLKEIKKNRQKLSFTNGYGLLFNKEEYLAKLKEDKMFITQKLFLNQKKPIKLKMKKKKDKNKLTSLPVKTKKISSADLTTVNCEAIGSSNNSNINKPQSSCDINSKNIKTDKNVIDNYVVVHSALISAAENNKDAETTCAKNSNETLKSPKNRDTKAPVVNETAHQSRSNKLTEIDMFETIQRNSIKPKHLNDKIESKQQNTQRNKLMSDIFGIKQQTTMKIKNYKHSMKYYFKKYKIKPCTVRLKQVPMSILRRYVHEDDLIKFTLTSKSSSVFQTTSSSSEVIKDSNKHATSVGTTSPKDTSTSQYANKYDKCNKIGLNGYENKSFSKKLSDKEKKPIVMKMPRENQEGVKMQQNDTILLDHKSEETKEENEIPGRSYLITNVNNNHNNITFSTSLSEKKFKILNSSEENKGKSVGAFDKVETDSITRCEQNSNNEKPTSTFKEKKSNNGESPNKNNPCNRISSQLESKSVTTVTVDKIKEPKQNHENKEDDVKRIDDFKRKLQFNKHGAITKKRKSSGDNIGMKYSTHNTISSEKIKVNSNFSSIKDKEKEKFKKRRTENEERIFGIENSKSVNGKSMLHHLSKVASSHNLSSPMPVKSETTANENKAIKNCGTDASRLQSLKLASGEMPRSPLSPPGKALLPSKCTETKPLSNDSVTNLEKNEAIEFDSSGSTNESDKLGCISSAYTLAGQQKGFYSYKEKHRRQSTENTNINIIPTAPAVRNQTNNAPIEGANQSVKNLTTTPDSKMEYISKNISGEQKENPAVVSVKDSTHHSVKSTLKIEESKRDSNPKINSNDESNDRRLMNLTYCGLETRLLKRTIDLTKSPERGSEFEFNTGNRRSSVESIAATQRFLREAVDFKIPSFEAFVCYKCKESFSSLKHWTTHLCI